LHYRARTWSARIPSGKSTSIPVVAAELAEAERALALHHATEEQIERLHDAYSYRSAAERVHAWRSRITVTSRRRHSRRKWGVTDTGQFDRWEVTIGRT
jgi:hypothetical protein